MGGLPPVLHALPVSAAAAGGEGRAVPPLAARLDRRHHAGQMRNAALVPRPLPAGHVHQRLPARAARGALRRPPAARSRTRSSARLQEGDGRGQRAQDAQAGRAARLDPPEGVWTAYGERNSYTDDDADRKDEFVREVATSRHWDLVWDIGANNGRYSRIAAEGASHGRGGRRRPGPDRAALPRPSRRGRRADPHAHDEPRRPVAGPRLARARAQVDAGPRQARPGAGARARPPRRDQRQRAGEGVRRLAGVASARRS